MSTAREIFAQIPLYTDDRLYRLIHLPPRAITAAAGVVAEIGTPLSALIADKDEVTILLPGDDWEEFAHRLPDHRVGGQYRLITFDQPLDPALTGFLALVTPILAEAGVPILVLSAFERDHLLVPAAQFDAAWQALKAAQARS